MSIQLHVATVRIILLRQENLRCLLSRCDKFDIDVIDMTLFKHVKCKKAFEEFDDN